MNDNMRDEQLKFVLETKDRPEGRSFIACASLQGIPTKGV